MSGLIGFVGLGNMGAFMVKNLMKNGKKVIVYDINKKILEQFKSLGAEVAKHPADISAASKMIVTMVPEGKDVKHTFTADNGLLKNNQEGTLYIDSSTIAQSDVFDIADIVKKHKSTFIDAPVSGGVTGAEAGTLTFMIGADGENYKKACELLQYMGKNLVKCEKLGSGQAAKICNNMLLAIHMIGVSETMNLGMKMGLDAKLLASIINTSTGRCWSGDTYNPVPGVIEGVPSSRGYSGGFGNALIAKDLGLAQTASTLTKSPTPLGSLAHQIYRILAKDKEYQGKDFSSVYQYIKDN
uniref:3-hydroxyisobutyrate dehydrogenase n=1 Tax=Parastrongyloides trichosuri TaxID=131310 RepID=A0A0N4ZQF7_PARTI